MYGSELSLEDAVSRALEYNLTLKKAEIDLASSGYSEKKLWSEVFPSISANASASYRNSLFSGNPPSNPGFGYSVGLGVSLALNAGIPYTMKSIKLAHQANILKYEDARNQLSIQVTKIFYSLIAEKNALSLFDEVFNLAQRQFARSETLFRNGLVGELSLTQSRLALENARYNLGSAKIIHENNMSDFLALIGITNSNAGGLDNIITLLGDINIVKIEADAEELIGNYLPSRPDIARNNQEIERLTIASMQNMLQTRAPSLNLSFDWSASSFSPFTDSVSATARLSIPIDVWIPGTPKAQAARKASDAIEKAKLDLESAESSAKTQIRSLTALLRNSWESIVIAKLSLEAAQRGYQLTEQGFTNGTVEALVLEDARNNMANARQRLLQSELSYFNMILDLSSALNVEWKYLVQIYGVPSE
ncbi:MAG: TolC family protein [Treponema sp.]|nr:TolC family protein [Treponema sp.]